MGTMTQTQHTPGPWHSDTVTNRDVKNAVWIFDQYGSLICKDVYGKSLEQSDANARLIAAAPDLLEELTRLIRSYEYALKAASEIKNYHDYRDKGAHYKEDDYWAARAAFSVVKVGAGLAIESARAAIAKAEGK